MPRLPENAQDPASRVTITSCQTNLQTKVHTRYGNEEEFVKQDYQLT